MIPISLLASRVLCLRRGHALLGTRRGARAERRAWGRWLLAVKRAIEAVGEWEGGKR